jgi:hypothetical protein
MIAYADGTEARVGDRVDYDGEPSTVEAILDTAEQCADWGLSERGLMFKNAAFGLVFEPVDSESWGATVFLGRGAEPAATADGGRDPGPS